MLNKLIKMYLFDNHMIILIFLTCYAIKLNAQTLCGDLESYGCKNWIQFKTFSEPTTNKPKALFYPQKTQTNVPQKEAFGICAKNNATLVEIETIDKQKIVESFFHQIDMKTELPYFWIGGYFVDYHLFRWLYSGHDFTFTNWLTGPFGSLNYTYIYGDYSETNSFGKWRTTNIGSFNVFCEISL